MFDMDRQQSRQLFFSAWKKFQDKMPLQPIESLVVDIIQLHPEYHTMLANSESNVDTDYFPEMGQTNPFLHLGLHIAIREQLSINQPFGIKDHYQRLLHKHQDAHTVEHLIMECLAQAIWEAQRNKSFPDNESYLACLTAL
jgi:hypothetical protein